MKIFGRSIGAPRHPLTVAYKRVSGRRATGADHEAFSRQLLSAPLFLATRAHAVRLEEAEVLVLDMASVEGTALPAYLEPPSAFVAQGHIGGSVPVTGLDACRIARERHCLELAIFAAQEGDPEFVVPWGLIDWLGPGLVPYFHRNSGDQAMLRDPVFQSACRAAVEPFAEIQQAEMIHGVQADGGDHPVIIATLDDSVSALTWFRVRDRIEAKLMEAEYRVTVITECEQVVLETYRSFDEMSEIDDSVWLKPS